MWTTGIAGDAPRPGLTTDVVYTEPGTYTATFRATDSRGAFRVATVQIEVDAVPLEPCFGARSDQFDGTTLDPPRWDVVRPDGNLRVADGALVLPTSATDIYQTTNTTTNIVVQALQPGAFQATTKVTLAAREQYQQAGLVLYGDDNNYIKMVVQGRTATADAAGRVFQFLKETNAVATEFNTPGIGAAYPDTFWVRLTSVNGTDVTGQYSADGVAWTDMGQTVTTAGITNPRIGLLSLTGRRSTSRSSTRGSTPSPSRRTRRPTPSPRPTSSTAPSWTPAAGRSCGPSRRRSRSPAGSSRCSRPTGTSTRPRTARP